MKFLIDFAKDTDKQKLFKILKSRKPKTYVIEIKEPRPKRTNKQNAYYWVCLGIIGQHCGYSSDEMHELMKYKFLGVEEKVVKQTGEMLKSLKSTQNLDSTEFTVYIDKIRLWGLQELDCYCPSPEEYYQNEIELNVKYLSNDY